MQYAGKPSSAAPRVPFSQPSLKQRCPYHYLGYHLKRKSHPIPSIWGPQEERRQQVLKLLKDSLSDDEATRLTARREVNELGKRADINDYMVFIFPAMNFQDEASPKKGELILKKYESTRSSVAPPRVSVDDPVVAVAAALGYLHHD
ncbi:hypothetical protein MTO96_024584 [Rhipicephalus appendiculatus]